MDHSSESKNIIEKISDLTDRISRIESYLNLDDSGDSTEDILKIEKKEKKSLETEIAQFWFAKVGIIVLVFGLGVILTLPFNKLPLFMPSLLGLVVSLGLFTFSKFLEKSNSLISKYLFGAGFFVLFIATLRLHYWGSTSYISNNFNEFILLFIIAATLLGISIKRKSIYLYNIGVLFTFVAGLISGNTYLIFLLILIFASISTYIKINFEWGRFFYWSIFLTYMAHFIWFINNPLIIGNKIELVTEPYINIFFLMLYLVIIALGNIFRKNEFADEKKKVTSSFINSVGFLLLFSLITLTQFRSEITVSFLIASLLFLSLATIFWKQQQDKYAIFFYSIIGYIFLSFAIVNQFEIPQVFIWLCWQSILVISTAIWFRSKIIILANFMIYLVIALSTLSLSDNYAWSTLNVGIVSLLSARILNAKKDRLELKTESMRIAYLVVAFIIIPLSTFQIVSQDYVGFTWLGLGLIYYGLSIILKNNKYRWMAIATLGITILYTLILTVMNPENELQVLSFIVSGIVLILISIFYTKMKTSEKSANS